MEKNLWKKILSKITIGLSMIWIYLPIIGGIITPMFYMLPVLFSSWFLFGLNWFSPEISFYYVWFDGYIVVTELSTIIVFTIFESIIFLFGCYILISGIIHLARARKEKIAVVETGPYKYIRHPQHLGIILISIPFALILPPADIGIRIGDVLSILLNIVILLIISEIEEVRMKQKHPEEYLIYQQKTGFFFPRIKRKEPDLEKRYIIKTKKQLALTYTRIIFSYLLSFALIVVVIYLLVTYADWINFVHSRELFG